MATRTAFIVALALLAPSPAKADHHLQKRALQEARCIPASLKQVSGDRDNVVYEARCKGARERMLLLICTASRCVIDDHRSHDPEDED